MGKPGLAVLNPRSKTRYDDPQEAIDKIITTDGVHAGNSGSIQKPAGRVDHEKDQGD
jgi:hypothetical protein